MPRTPQNKKPPRNVHEPFRFMRISDERYSFLMFTNVHDVHLAHLIHLKSVWQAACATTQKTSGRSARSTLNLFFHGFRPWSCHFSTCARCTRSALWNPSGAKAPTA